MIKHIAIFILLSTLSFTSNAEWSVAGGPELHKDKGNTYGEIRWRDTLLDDGAFVEGAYADRFGYSLYAGSMNTLGGDLFLTWDKFTFGFGIEYATPSDVVDSEGGYELLFEYAITEHWAASLKHRSNCRQICNVPVLNMLPHGDDDKPNGGYNFLTVRYSW